MSAITGLARKIAKEHTLARMVYEGDKRIMDRAAEKQGVYPRRCSNPRCHNVCVSASGLCAECEAKGRGSK